MKRWSAACWSRANAGVNPLVVVLGHEAERVQGALEGISTSRSQPGA